MRPSFFVPIHISPAGPVAAEMYLMVSVWRSCLGCMPSMANRLPVLFDATMPMPGSLFSILVSLERSRCPSALRFITLKLLCVAFRQATPCRSWLSQMLPLRSSASAIMKLLPISFRLSSLVMWVCWPVRLSYRCSPLPYVDIHTRPLSCDTTFTLGLRFDCMSSFGYTFSVNVLPVLASVYTTSPLAVNLMWLPLLSANVPLLLRRGAPLPAGLRL